jgi:hypothetical protein
MLVSANHCCAVNPYVPASRLPTCPQTFARRKAQRTRSRAGIFAAAREAIAFHLMDISLYLLFSSYCQGSCSLVSARLGLVGYGPDGSGNHTESANWLVCRLSISERSRERQRLTFLLLSAFRDRHVLCEISGFTGTALSRLRDSTAESVLRKMS